MDVPYTSKHCYSHALERYLLETDRYKEFLIKDVYHKGETCQFTTHVQRKQGLCLDLAATAQQKGKSGNLDHICLEMAKILQINYIHRCHYPDETSDIASSM